jgi:hypothetical protein
MADEAPLERPKRRGLGDVWSDWVSAQNYFVQVLLQLIFSVLTLFGITVLGGLVFSGFESTTVCRWGVRGAAGRALAAHAYVTREGFGCACAQRRARQRRRCCAMQRRSRAARHTLRRERTAWALCLPHGRPHAAVCSRWCCAAFPSDRR